jgi:hypothetical protein
VRMNARSAFHVGRILHARRPGSGNA